MWMWGSVNQIAVVMSVHMLRGVGQCQSDSSGDECAHVMWMWDSVNQIAVVMSVHMLCGCGTVSIR